MEVKEWLSSLLINSQAIMKKIDSMHLDSNQFSRELEFIYRRWFKIEMILELNSYKDLSMMVPKLSICMNSQRTTVLSL